MTTHDEATADRTHYHGDGCTTPHPTEALADAIAWRLPPSWRTCEAVAAEVLRLLASGECDELNAAVADAVAANPERYGWEPWENGKAGVQEFRAGVPFRHAWLEPRREAVDQEGRDDGD